MAKGKKTGGGSRLGKPNKTTQEIRDAVNAVMPQSERFKKLASMARGGNYKALELLCFYAEGKPKESIDLNHTGDLKVIRDNR